NPYVPDGGVLKAPFTVAFKGADRVTLKVGDEKHELRRDEYTPWVRVSFEVAPGVTIYGLCRFLLLESPFVGADWKSARPAADGQVGNLPPQGGGHFGLYVTPINIDPESPVMPISSPAVFSTYLRKAQGPYATLGLAEDTWAVNEH